MTGPEIVHRSGPILPVYFFFGVAMPSLIFSGTREGLIVAGRDGCGVIVVRSNGD